MIRGAESAQMARWRVDYLGKVLMTLGSVEAPDQESAIAQAAEFL